MRNALIWIAITLLAVSVMTTVRFAIVAHEMTVCEEDLTMRINALQRELDRLERNNVDLDGFIKYMEVQK